MNIAIIIGLLIVALFAIFLLSLFILFIPTYIESLLMSYDELRKFLKKRRE